MCLCLQDNTVDLRQIYLSVSALSEFTSFKSLLHTAFTVSHVFTTTTVPPPCASFIFI